MAYDDDQFDNTEEDTEEEDSPVSVDENGDPIEDPDEDDMGAHGFHDPEAEDDEETF